MGLNADNKTIAKALALAHLLHDGQKRRYTNEPYIYHPIRVAKICQRAGLDAEAVAVALLHDVVEDTVCTTAHLHAIMGQPIAAGVEYLTEYPMASLNRAQRKALQSDKLAAAPAWIQTIKAADLYDNGKSIYKHDPKFGKQFRMESMDLLLMAMDETNDGVHKLNMELLKRN